VLFKETLPAALGLETLHTMLAHDEVRAGDVVRMLATSAGWRLALNQVLVGAVAAVAFALVAAILHRLWAREAMTAAPAPQALVR
jgi:hypothetical protein